MAGAELTPAVARSQPDVGAAQDDQAGGVELPLWQIEVGVGAVLALLLIAAYLQPAGSAGENPGGV